MIGTAKPMRIVGEYLAKAAVFEAMTDYETDPVDKERYAALAATYRRLARERQWTLAKRAMERMPYQKPPHRDDTEPSG
jgi:hypothetical protein